MDPIALLQRLVQTPSISRDESATAGILAAELALHGLVVQRTGNNVWAVDPHYSPGRPTLMLNSHHDTVKPAAGYTRPPFEGTIDGGKVRGLGSNDAGGSLVALTATFLELLHAPRPVNLVLALSAEEEVSGIGGMRMMLPEILRQVKIDMAIVGEPTGMRPAIGERGLVVLDGVSTGRAGHAARHEGDNALYHALDDIAVLRDFRWQRTSPLLGPIKVTVTQIEAGRQHNVVPDRCTFTVDVRSNELYSNEEICRTVCKHVRGEVKARSFRLNSSHIDSTHPLVRRAVEAGRVPFGSPTLSDQALMPFPSLKMGPGQSSRSHTADEFIETGEIREAIELYIRLLDGLCL